jgi:hypothetical protein
VLSCAILFGLAIQIASADLVAGVASSITTYMSTIVALLTRPSAFVQHISQLSSSEADRQAAAATSFYLINYVVGVSALFYLSDFKDVRWFLRWLLAGSVFALASICGASVVAAFSTQALGHTTSTANIIAVLGYESGIVVLIYLTGSLLVLSIIKSRAPEVFQAAKESNFQTFYRPAQFDAITYGLVGFFGIGTQISAGAYSTLIAIAAFGIAPMPYTIAGLLFVLAIYKIRSLFVNGSRTGSA